MQGIAVATVTDLNATHEKSNRTSQYDGHLTDKFSIPSDFAMYIHVAVHFRSAFSEGEIPMSLS